MISLNGDNDYDNPCCAGFPGGPLQYGPAHMYSTTFSNEVCSNFIYANRFHFAIFLIQNTYPHLSHSGDDFAAFWAS